VDAGFADLAAVTAALREVLRARGVQLIENCEPRGIGRSGPTWTVHTDAGPVESDVLVVTAGLRTNDILSLVPGCSVRFPLCPDRPTQSKYFIPPPGGPGAPRSTLLMNSSLFYRPGLERLAGR
jgi:glycine/D-amino acid oxidase-like deaminating enzyme